MLSAESLPRSPIDVEFISAELADELQDARRVEVAPNVFVGYKLLNRRYLGERAAVVAIGGFLSDLTAADRAYEGLQLSTLARPVLMLDLPGHGLSTPHNRAQIVDLCLKRDASSQTEPLLDAVLKLIDPDDSIDYFGISHGSLLSMKAAELDPGDRVETIFGIDLPAIKKRITVGLQVGYLIKDNFFGARKYRRAIKGSGIKQDFEEFKEFYDETEQEHTRSFIRNNSGLFLLNFGFSINASPVGLWSWRRVMEEKSARVNIHTSENGTVSDADVIDEFIQSLPEAQRKRSRQVVVEGEDHNIGRTELLPRAVNWARESYKH